MALTIANKEFSGFQNKRAVMCDLTFDSSYATGGEAVTPGTVNLKTVDHAIFETKDGYQFHYDKTNEKIKALIPKQIPAIVYDEVQAVNTSTGAATLNYPAAFIMNVAQTGGQNLKLRSTGVTLASLGSNECCLSALMAWGTQTGLTCNPALDALAGEGAFTGAATNWTLGTGWTYNTNAVDKDGDGTGTLSHDNFAAVVGKTYKVTYTISAWSVGTVTPALGGATGTAVGADATYTEYFTATSTAGITFTPTNTSRFTIDAVTIVLMEAKVTYVTQAWREVWDNLVQDEAITLATGANTMTSGNKILACMYIDQTTATAAALTMIDSDDTAASGEVDLLFNSATSQLTVHSAQNAKAAKLTYVKVPSSGFLFDRMFANETMTKEGTDPYRNISAKPVLLWGYAGQVPVNGGTTQRLIDWTSTPAAGEATIDWFSQTIRGHASTPTAAGASHNHAFTGTEPISSLNLATPAFSGTGLTAVAQVITTTDNQTMALNQCAGMWLYPVTQTTPPVLILSNTAVTGAPAVLTVQGVAVTDAGTYKIVKHLAPVGTNAAEATHTHAITKSTAMGAVIDVKSDVTCTAAGVWGLLEEVAARQIPAMCEVESGTDLSGVSIRGLFVGV